MISAFPRLAAAQDALDANRYDEAAQIALSHVRAHPDDPRGLELLGKVAMRMGALGQAEQFLRQALKRAPNSIDVLHELSSCLQQQERLVEALELFNQLKVRKPEEPQYELMMGLTLDKLGRSEEAHRILGSLAERYPDNINIWLAHAHNLRSAGRTDDAIQAYRHATKIDPERGDTWWGLASIRKKVFTDEDIATMQEQVSIAVDVANLAPLHLALARAWHERQKFEEAFSHYTEGNRVRAESLNYNARELTDEVSQVEQLFDRTFFETVPEGGDPSAAPIFIISLPRSGSTLLEQMLGSHHDIEPLGELPHIPALLRAAMEGATRRGLTRVPDAIRAMTPADCTIFGREYLRRAALHRTGDAPRFTDKLPHNWSNILFIRRILPQAKFIDIRRSAMDCCFSNFTQSFSRAHASSFTLEHIGQSYVDYVRLMDHLDRAAPGLVHHLRYEQLIEQPEPELRAIFGYLGVEWDDAPLNFHQLDRVVRTPSAEQVRRPLNREGVEVWKPYAGWLEPLREILGTLADA